MKIIEGSITSSPDYKIGIVVSRWNDFITERLKDGALSALKRHGVSDDQLVLAYCPGSYEIPLTAKALLDRAGCNGVITLGAVIRGATPHFDYVCSAVNSGVANLAIQTGKPVIFGVLTTDTIEQAIERAGTKAGNKGEESAIALLEMLSVVKQAGN